MDKMMEETKNELGGLRKYELWKKERENECVRKQWGRMKRVN